MHHVRIHPRTGENIHFGVRQNWVTWTVGSSEMQGTNCVLEPKREFWNNWRTAGSWDTHADAAFPTTPTRFPFKSTSGFHLAEWNISPLKLSNPGILGSRGVSSTPIAEIRMCAVLRLRSPVIVSSATSSYSWATSSHFAEITFLLRIMWS